MADVSRDFYEGILVPDIRISPESIWDEHTTATEADPQAGPVTSLDTDRAMLEAVGDPIDATPIYLRTQQSGMPGVHRAGFVWRSDPNEPWLGWDVPSSVSSTEMVAHASSANTGYRYPSAVALDDGTLLVASGEASTGGRRISIRHRPWGDPTWTVPGIIYAEPAVGYLHPRLVLLPSGRVLCFYLHFDADRDRAQVGYFYSDDPTSADPATWVRAEEALLPQALSTKDDVPTRLRVARNPVNGQYMLLVQHGDVVRQYASRDDGVSFDLVSDSLDIGAAEVVVVDGVFVVAATDASATCYRSASAYSPITLSSSGGWPGSPGDLALVADESGSLYLYSSSGNFLTSGDGGVTWASGPTGVGFTAQRWADLDSTVRPTNVSGVARRGTVVLLCNQPAPSGNTGALTALHMGGYTDVTLPPEAAGRQVGRQTWYSRRWLGQTSPLTVFNDDSVGVPMITKRPNGSWRIETAAGVTAQIGYDPPPLVGAPFGREVMASASWSTLAGTSRLSLRWGDGTETSHAGVRVTDDTLELVDHHDGDAVIGDAEIEPGARIEVRFALHRSNVTVFWRVYSVDVPRRWALLGSSSSLTRSTSSADERIRFYVAPGGRADWHDIGVIFDSRTMPLGTSTPWIGQSFAAGVSNPDDLFARPLPAVGSAYVTDGIGVRGRSGPTLRGEEHVVEYAYPHPLRNLLPRVAPSPRQRWISASASGQAIAFETDSAAFHQDSDVLGLYLGGWLCAQVSLHRRTAADVWQHVTTIDRFLAITYARAGSSLVPSTSGGAVAGPYLHRDELVGGYVIIEGVSRKIIGNTEGHWSTGPVSQKRAAIYLEPCELNGDEPTSGTIPLIFPDSLTLVHMGGATSRGWRLLLHPIPDPAITAAPPGGRIAGGVLALGPVVVLGAPAEREVRTVHETQLGDLVLPDGSRRTRVTGPLRRRVTIPLGLVDVTSARGLGDGDYVRGTSTTGAPPVAHRHDLPLMLEGLMSQIDGEHTPVVWIPRLSAGPPDVETLLVGRAGGAIYGRATWGGYRQVLGDAMDSEVFDLSALTITEER